MLRRYCGAVLLALLHLSLCSAKCVNWCSQHGLCIGTGEDAYCDCEIGYSGAGCERKICPKADDPLTKNQNFRAIRLTTTAVSGEISGVLGVHFHGEQTFFDADGSKFDGKACAKAVQRLPNVAEASCLRENVTASNGASYVITIHSWPLIPHQNNLYEHNGNPPLRAFSCDISQAEGGVGTECLLADVVTQNVQEYAECSRHGSCDSKTGICECELGFHGLACEDITDNVDAMVAHADGPFFTANVLHVHANRRPSPEFNLLKATAGKTDILTLSGQGALQHSGTLDVEGAVSLHGGVVEVGARESALSIQTSRMKHVNTVVAIAATKNMRALFDIQDNEGHTIMAWGMDKNITIPSAKLFMPDGSIVLNNGQLMAKTAEFSSALKIQAGGKIQLDDNFEASPKGLVVEATDISTSAALTARVASPHFGGTVMKSALESLSETSAHFQAETDGQLVFQVDGAGVARSRGLEVTAGGVQVAGGGLVVDAGGLVVHGGLKVASGGLAVANDALQVESVAAKVTSSSGTSALLGEVASQQYFGDVLKLSCNASNNYNFVAAFKDAEEVFAVSESGDIRSKGSLELAKGANIKGHTRLQSSLAIAKLQLAAESNVVVLPVSAAFVEITVGQHAVADLQTTLQFPTEMEGASEGQVVIVQNSAGYSLAEPSIPNGGTVPFIFDGQQWKALNALSLSTSRLSDVREFVAANDLDIGAFSFSAQQLAASGQNQHTIPIFGAGGVLTGREDFSFQSGILSTPTVKTQRLEGKLDCSEAIFNVPLIDRATIRSAESISTKKLTLQVSTEPIIMLGLSKEGELMPSPMMDGDGTVDFSGVRIRKVLSDLDLGGHRLHSVTNVQSSVVTAETLEANSISVRTLPRNRVLYIDDNGKLASTNVVIDNGAIVEKKKVDDEPSGPKLTDSLIDMTNKTLVRPHLLSPEISDVLKLSVGTMQVMALRPGSLVSVDVSGSLESVLGVAVEGRKLTVDTLAVHEIASDVDMSGHTLSNVKFGKGPEFSAPIQDLAVHSLKVLSPSAHKQTAEMLALNADGTVTKIETVTANKDEVRVDTMLHVAHDTLVEGSITALGAVMGTGPYVDASDRRYKIDEREVSESDANDIVSKLQAFTYHYDNEKFPHKKFPSKPQIGWMAQDVQQVIPEIVESDADGFLSVAYARAVPVLAEALKSVQRKVEQLEQQLAQLQSDCKRFDFESNQSAYQETKS